MQILSLSLSFDGVSTPPNTTCGDRATLRPRRGALLHFALREFNLQTVQEPPDEGGLPGVGRAHHEPGEAEGSYAERGWKTWLTIAAIVMA